MLRTVDYLDLIHASQRLFGFIFEPNFYIGLEETRVNHVLAERLAFFQIPYQVERFDRAHLDQPGVRSERIGANQAVRISLSHLGQRLRLRLRHRHRLPDLRMDRLLG